MKRHTPCARGPMVRTRKLTDDSGPCTTSSWLHGPGGRLAPASRTTANATAFARCSTTSFRRPWARHVKERNTTEGTVHTDGEVDESRSRSDIPDRGAVRVSFEDEGNRGSSRQPGYRTRANRGRGTEVPESPGRAK